jgi:hypothetical protein
LEEDMTSESATRDTQLGEAIEAIAVPELPQDFLARTAEMAIGSDARTATTVARSRRRWRIATVVAAAAVVAAVAGGFIGAAVTHAPAPARAASPVLAFSPATDWNSVVAPLPGKLQANNEVAWASNVPFEGGDLASGWPLNTVKKLPAAGVVVFASLAHRVDDPQTYPDRGAPLRLADGYFLSSGYEGQPASNVSLQMIYARVNGQYVLVQVWFGRNTPTDAQKQEADAELARLVIPR